MSRSMSFYSPPLEEGWLRYKGKCIRSFESADGVVKNGRRSIPDHPVCAALEWDLFVDGAATPPSQGGE